ncbi:hypothetical protein CPB84DRAFT_1850623 [Gymnopilus junonius]|uniref:Uncharacterized protein n=1 Tax=Gymnopilus junonius TaxID=109634 RepID=A0A9P5TJC5_GYMJU|nr:hypothetical protein CPB84DRAFT_1850623 [Gymnopilus junonius]
MSTSTSANVSSSGAARPVFLFDPKEVKVILEHTSESGVAAFKAFIDLPADLVDHPYFSYARRQEWVVLEQYAHYINTWSVWFCFYRIECEGSPSVDSSTTKLSNARVKAYRSSVQVEDDSVNLEFPPTFE